MLREIRSLNQERGVGRRRWFESDELDLVVWFDDGPDNVSGFQLCYESGDGPHALTWRQQSGFVHNRIDAGDETPLKNRAPVLRDAESEPDWAEVARRFEACSASLEPPIRELVRDKLAEHERSARPDRTDGEN